jgi:hypothetical protein
MVVDVVAPKGHRALVFWPYIVILLKNENWTSFRHIDS